MKAIKVPSGEDSGSSFSAPKAQELLMFAMKIQKGDNVWIKETVETNPRILCTSSDGPTILQEGARYNALHIAARWGNLEAAALVLNEISNLSFMQKLYPNDDDKIRKDRTRYLSDMYLNTPDKGALDTPLHFACKFSWYEVANILVNHPLTDLNIRNYEKRTAEQIIGSRAKKNTELAGKIRSLFHENYIVPIWRDPICPMQPVVGPVVNPKCLAQFTPLPFYQQFKEIDLDFYGPVDQSVIPPPNLGSQKVIKAYAGPMNNVKAEQFCKALRHSGKCGHLQSFAQDQTCTPPSSPQRWTAESSTPTSPIPPLLNIKSPLSPLFTSTPTRSSTPLTPRHNYNNSSFGLLSTSQQSPFVQLMQDRSIRLADPDKGIERIARKYAKEMKVPFFEYWKFTDKFLNMTSLEGLFELENHLSYMEDKLSEGGLRDIEVDSPLSNVCQAFNGFHLGNSTPKKENSLLDWKDDWRDGLRKRLDFKTEKLDLSIINGGNHPDPEKINQLTQLFSSPRMNVIDQTQKFHFKENGEFDRDEDASEDVFNQSSSSDLLRYSSSSDDSCNPTQERLGLIEIEKKIKDDEFFTPPSSPKSKNDLENVETFEDCESLSVFLNGPFVSKEDYQLQIAFALVMEDLSHDKFPAIYQWYNTVKALGNCNKCL